MSMSFDDAIVGILCHLILFKTTTKEKQCRIHHADFSFLFAVCSSYNIRIYDSGSNKKGLHLTGSGIIMLLLHCR